MKCLRIYATPDGESHFDEIALPTTKRSVHPEAVPFDITASYPSSHIRITHIPAGMREIAWHGVPEKILVVRLDGSVVYETSDGEQRQVQAGRFVLLEDTHGKGHLSRHSPDAQTVIWISLPNGLDRSPIRPLRYAVCAAYIFDFCNSDTMQRAIRFVHRQSRRWRKAREWIQCDVRFASL